MTTRVFTAINHKKKDIYVAQCPEISTVSQGESVEFAITNFKEATKLYLKKLPLSGIRLPITLNK